MPTGGYANSGQLWAWSRCNGRCRRAASAAAHCTARRLPATPTTTAVAAMDEVVMTAPQVGPVPCPGDDGGGAHRHRRPHRRAFSPPGVLGQVRRALGVQDLGPAAATAPGGLPDH